MVTLNAVPGLERVEIDILALTLKVTEVNCSERQTSVYRTQEPFTYKVLLMLVNVSAWTERNCGKITQLFELSIVCC